MVYRIHYAWCEAENASSPQSTHLIWVIWPCLVISTTFCPGCLVALVSYNAHSFHSIGAHNPLIFVLQLSCILGCISCSIRHRPYASGISSCPPSIYQFCLLSTGSLHFHCIEFIVKVSINIVGSSAFFSSTILLVPYQTPLLNHSHLPENLYRKPQPSHYKYDGKWNLLTIKPGFSQSNIDWHFVQVPGRQCPACLKNDNEVWVIPGKNCPQCGTPVN